MKNALYIFCTDCLFTHFTLLEIVSIYFSRAYMLFLLYRE